MDTRTLRNYLHLAETLHFGRASELCHISPSALSRNIKQLEEELGVTLLYRDNRSVSLSHEGKLFQQYARDALSQWDATRQRLLSEAEELHGEISVYCSVTASYSFLYDILNRFRQRFPAVEIKLHTGDPDHAIQHILSDKEDIAIAARPDHIPNELAFNEVGISPLLFIAPLEANFDVPQKATQWAEAPMILSEEGVSRQRVNAWFQQQQIAPKIYAQVAGNEAIVSMVSLGFGIGVVPQIVLENSPLADRVKVLDVQPQLTPYHIGLFALNRKLRHPLIQAFWSVLDQ